jgi:hypothetical protein
MRTSRSFRQGEKTRDMIEGCMDDIKRKPCKFGLKCYRRNAEHLEKFLHPDNDEYSLSLWKFRDCRGEFLTLQQCMKFMDPFDKGIVDDKELLGELLKHIKGDGAPAGDDLQAIWSKIDDDGNGFVSFAEFIEWATEYGLGLPVGLDEQNGGSSGSQCAGLKCGYPGCNTGRNGLPCISFKPTRNGPSYMCRCRHKRSVHFVQDSLTEIQVPEYWKTATSLDADAAAADSPEWVDVSDKKHHFQSLMDNSYRKVWTRDRGRTEDGKQKRVPTGYTVISVQRNENKRIWRKYHLKKSLIASQVQRLGEGDPDFKAYEVKTTQDSVRSDVAAIIGGPLDQSCNEWLLWHGTSLEGARQICDEDFKQRYAGSATGTLYGKGTYFAESVTKADEYAKEAKEHEARDSRSVPEFEQELHRKIVSGAKIYTVLLCRVTGGLVRYTDEAEPDSQKLTDEVLHGVYDSVLGDREACRQTFKEFVVFGSDQVYPEYIIHYARI